MHTRLCLVRHGETDWNVVGRLQGSIDIPLNAHGIRQAHAAAASLVGLAFDVIYSSTQTRARMTADIVGAKLELTPRPEPRLRERNLGLMEGLLPTEAEAQYPQAYLPLKARRPDYGPPQGEPVEAFAERVGAVLDEVLAQHTGQVVLAVAHGGVLDMFYRLVTATPFHVERTWRLRNGALNWLEHDGCRWSVRAWDDNAHLQAALDEKGA